MDSRPPTGTARPLPWPTLRRQSTAAVVLIRLAAVCCLVSGVGAAVLTTPFDLPVWRAVTWGAGLVLTVVSAAVAWVAIVRVPSRTTGAGVGRGSRHDRRQVRRALLSGRPLDDAGRRLVAVDVANGAVLPSGVGTMGFVLGPQIGQRATDLTSTFYLDTALGVLLAVPAAIMVAFLGLLPRWLRVRRAAAAIGASPTVEDDDRARRSGGTSPG